MVRTEKELFAALAYTAAGIQLKLQKDRTYNQDKHFLLTMEEFVEHFELMTTTTNVGWYLLLGVPVWIGNLNSEVG